MIKSDQRSKPAGNQKSHPENNLKSAGGPAVQKPTNPEKRKAQQREITEFPSPQKQIETVLPEKKKSGRPKAKRSDPDFVQFTTYIRQETHLAVKIALLKQEYRQEMSELVQVLLEEWLRVNK